MQGPPAVRLKFHPAHATKPEPKDKGVRVVRKVVDVAHLENLAAAEASAAGLAAGGGGNDDGLGDAEVEHCGALKALFEVTRAFYHTVKNGDCVRAYVPVLLV
jgi:hypothetical protein